MGYGEIEPPLLGCEQRGTGAGGRVNARHSCERRGSARVDYVDEPFPARHINALALRVVEHVVGVSDDIEGADLLPTRRVEHEDLRRLPTADKHTMARLIERHRIVRPG